MNRKWIYGICITAICALVILNVTHILTGGSSQTVRPGTNDTYGLPDNDTFVFRTPIFLYVFMNTRYISVIQLKISCYFNT